MKISQKFLTLVLLTGFNCLSADSEMLEKVKIAQKINAALPRIVAVTTGTLKGIALFSQEKTDVKGCIMSVVTLFEDAQIVKTEEQAQKFARKLNSKIIECSQIMTVENLDINTNELLPMIQIPQQFAAAFPDETKVMLARMELAIAQENGSVNDRQKVILALSLIQKILTITTEEQAQKFVAELKDHAEVFKN